MDIMAALLSEAVAVVALRDGGLCAAAGRTDRMAVGPVLSNLPAKPPVWSRLPDRDHPVFEAAPGVPRSPGSASFGSGATSRPMPHTA